eukprot:CAMPEP_0201584680 /NCGR_PEP_ID=MMETSP0190_2-20130828/113555_1 /ASSEMBLY_ACC=CAM_ASM_000263 /TAXON_ID=37353 /ORGANISM="Rosalina sp." /LENGTH=39 /DNA_ID= /DNA_START= /DNA_END= /DNA_ORIENTATION=
MADGSKLIDIIETTILRVLSRSRKKRRGQIVLGHFNALM